MGSPAAEPLSLDRYELLRPLGRGAMGSVYEGRHRITGRHVAIKVLHPEFATNKVIVERFFNEARAAATIGHPNIVECLDAGTASSGQPYLVLQYLQGQSLAAELEKVHTLPPVRAVRIALQVASALSAAHARGVVHRDLKPDNIFLSKHRGQEDHVTVLDFGISRFHGSGSELMTRAGAVLGTPAYMAPEQLADSSTVEGTADIYALGASLYQVLTGSIPFSAESLIALADKIATEPPRPLERVRPGISPALSRVVLRAMAKAPRDRYPTMQAFAAALAAATGVEPLAEEHTDRTAPHRPDGGDTGQSRTEEVEIPDEADLKPRPAGIRATANPLSTRAAWAGPKRSNWGLIGGAIGGGVVVLLIVAGVLSHHETRAVEPMQVVGASAKVEAPLAAVAVPASPPDAPPVAVGERVLTVPGARPGFVPALPLVTTRFPMLPINPKPKKADRDVHAKIVTELAKPVPSIHELEREHKAFSEMVGRYGYTPSMQLVRSWLALTLAEAHRAVTHPPVDFTGKGCHEELVAEGIAATDKARKILDENPIKVDMLESANRGYIAYFDGVAHECQGDFAKASKAYLDAFKVGDQVNPGFRRSVLLHVARVSLALGDARRAQDMLDQCYEAAPTSERQTLQVWAGALTWNCATVVRVGREMRQQAVKDHAAPPPWLDRLEAACITDPASDQGQSPTTADAYFGEPAGQHRLDEARQAFGDVSSPAAALRSALRLCYFRDRLAASPDSLAVTVGGRFEQPTLSGAPADRLAILQPCLAAELLADKLRGPIAESTVELRVGSGM